MHKTTLYIGSPNGIGKMDADYREKIRSWAAACCPDGYTLVFGEGGWRDTQEETAILTVYTLGGFLGTKVQHLRELLHQTAILVETALVEVHTV